MSPRRASAQTTNVRPAPAADPAWSDADREVLLGGRGRITVRGAESRVRPLSRLFLALPAIAAIALVPWTVGLATLLPHRAVAYHWNVAWTGLDAAIAIGLASTSWLSRRRQTGAALTAVATATLMCTDAWFDLCTSAPGSPVVYAAAEAVAELMVASVCLTIGLRSRRDAAANPGS